MPKVSIIIPVYNVEKYLDVCLKSAINQTLYDIEIICIEDCSTDASMAILEEYAKKDNRIKVIQNEKNSGLSYSRNIGMDIAQGDYVQFLDSDDYLLEDAIECFYKIALENDLDLLKADFLSLNEGTGAIVRVEGNSINGICDGKQLLFEMEKKHNTYRSAWLNFIKLDLIRENNLKFYNGIFHEDILFTFELYLFAKRCMYIHEYKYVYRKRPDSITTIEKTSNHLYGFLVAMNEVLKRGLSIDRSMYFEYATISYLIRIYKNAQGVLRRMKTDVNNEGWDEDIVFEYDFLCLDDSRKTYINDATIQVNMERIMNSKRVVIYGAGRAAEDVMNILRHNDIVVDGIAVTDVSKSEKTFFGHRVRNIDDFLEFVDDVLILVAITPKYVDDVLQRLDEKGFKNVIYMCADVN